MMAACMQMVHRHKELRKVEEEIKQLKAQPDSNEEVLGEMNNEGGHLLEDYQNYHIDDMDHHARTNSMHTDHAPSLDTDSDYPPSLYEEIRAVLIRLEVVHLLSTSRL